MPPLPFHYSLDFTELMLSVTRDLDAWLDHELSHGGTTDIRVDYKISELIEHYVPSSPRQLMELGMQCEELLGIEIEDPIFGHHPEDAYDALRVAIARYVGGELSAQWEARKERADMHSATVAPSPSGNGSRPAEDDELADAA